MSDPNAHGLPETAPRHDHLCHPPDGTGLHAPLGQLLRHPDTGEACCPLCGRWFRAPGSHVRIHG